MPTRPSDTIPTRARSNGPRLQYVQWLPIRGPSLSFTPRCMRRSEQARRNAAADPTPSSMLSTGVSAALDRRRCGVLDVCARAVLAVVGLVGLDSESTSDKESPSIGSLTATLSCSDGSWSQRSSKASGLSLTGVWGTSDGPMSAHTFRWCLPGCQDVGRSAGRNLTETGPEDWTHRCLSTYPRRRPHSTPAAVWRRKEARLRACQKARPRVAGSPLSMEQVPSAAFNLAHVRIYFMYRSPLPYVFDTRTTWTA